MYIQMFNVWYFFWLVLSIEMFLGLYLLLRNKSEKTKKIVLFSFLAFALALHFLKAFFPPYSNNIDRLYRDSWFEYRPNSVVPIKYDWVARLKFTLP